MKKVFTLLITVEGTVTVENIFNKFRIGLNDWDKSKVLELNGQSLVNYTIICDDITYNAIVNRIYNG